MPVRCLAVVLVSLLAAAPVATALAQEPALGDPTSTYSETLKTGQKIHTPAHHAKAKVSKTGKTGKKGSAKTHIKTPKPK
jgi:hypothetical protein